MAMAKKGARTIIVDSAIYRWRIRRKPTYSQGLEQSNLTVAVELVTDHGGVCTLVVDTSVPHPSGWISKTPVSVTPAVVGIYIRQALKQGWQPNSSGSPFPLVADEEWL